MTFEVLPVLDCMIDFYKSPADRNRFQHYLQILQGNTKGDLLLPVGGFNPMAKEHVPEKLLELKALNIEQLMQETLNSLNKQLASTCQAVFKVAFNLSDDLKGGWTNRYTADYDSKFKLSALLQRNFCVALFWVSENYDEQIITTRTLEYCYRTIFQSAHPKPQTLQQHILQETFVAKHTQPVSVTEIDFENLISFYETHKNTTDYNTIFNFLYGDAAAESLGNTGKGIKNEFAGYRFAARLAHL